MISLWKEVLHKPPLMGYYLVYEKNIVNFENKRFDADSSISYILFFCYKAHEIIVWKGCAS